MDRVLNRNQRRRLSAMLIAMLVLLAPPFAATATETVDLEIVIAADVSSSIDEREAALQRQGFAAALRSPEVIRAIQSGATGKIAVAYIDWSSEPWNRLIVDWRIIEDQASADAFAAALLAAPRSYGQGTAIGGALRMATQMIESNDLDGLRRVIDISGDGPNNRGSLASAREATLARGITVNGLPILTDYPGLDAFFERNVIGGPGAFMVPATGFHDFADAVLHKLIREVAGTPPRRDLAETAPRAR